MRALLFEAAAHTATNAAPWATRCGLELDCIAAKSAYRPGAGWLVRAWYVAEPHVTEIDARDRGLRLVDIDDRLIHPSRRKVA